LTWVSTSVEQSTQELATELEALKSAYSQLAEINTDLNNQLQHAKTENYHQEKRIQLNRSDVLMELLVDEICKISPEDVPQQNSTIVIPPPPRPVPSSTTGSTTNRKSLPSDGSMANSGMKKKSAPPTKKRLCTQIFQKKWNKPKPQQEKRMNVDDDDDASDEEVRD
jgi:hypothetical protein